MLRACVVVALVGSAVSWVRGEQVLHVVSSARNDVFVLLSGDAGSLPCSLRRHDALDAALAAALPGDGLLVLADGSTPAATAVSASEWAAIGAARLSGAYVEMPASLPGAPNVSYAPSAAYYYDRLVAFTGALSAQGLAPLDLLVAQGAWFLAYPPLAAFAADAVLGYAHVAGSETAVYGLTPPAERNPVLFPVALAAPAVAPPVLVAAIALSCVVSCRYTPQPRWRSVWDFIMASVLGVPAAFPPWTPLVGPSAPSPVGDPASPTARASSDDLLASLLRATDFLAVGSGLLVQGDAVACPSPHAPAGAPLACMLEGFVSAVSANGSQAADTNARVDCTAEAAMALAVRALVDRGTPGAGGEFAFVSAALLNWTWLWSDAAQGARANASDAAYGLLMWGVSQPSWEIASYGDDNARALLGSLAAVSVLRSISTAPLDTRAWDTQLLISVLANLRITSTHGFRPGRINYADIERDGWRHYAASDATYANTLSPQPHYQAQMWAVFVWTWAHTGWEPLWAAAVAGVEGSMAAFATGVDAWRWTEYRSEEVGRLLLPVAWLVRGGALRPGGANATHVAWLYALADDLLASQQPSGAIHETLGAAGRCDACPPPSNSAYGSGEAPLIAADGDPIVDLLYGSNFYLLALQEAFRATGDWARLGEPAARLAAFLARVQLTSTAFPQLSGSWMRAFDTRWWEPWGSAADSGWGPWSIESGWTTTWITAGLHAVATNSSLWELTASNASGVNAQLLAELCPLLHMTDDHPCP